MLSFFALLLNVWGGPDKRPSKSNGVPVCWASRKSHERYRSLARSDSGTVGLETKSLGVFLPRRYDGPLQRMESLGVRETATGFISFLFIILRRLVLVWTGLICGCSIGNDRCNFMTVRVDRRVTLNGVDLPPSKKIVTEQSIHSTTGRLLC